MSMTSPTVLTLPGWLSSGPEHWQSRWEALHGDCRVEQADWEWPRRGDWMARLDEVVIDLQQPCLLAAHSLGCHLVAAWSAHSAHARRVLAALLVAPPDLGRADLPPQLFSWRPPVTGALPFPARLVASDDDPYASLEASRQMAAGWHADLQVLIGKGHLNAASGLGDWPDGRAMLMDLVMRGTADRS